MSWVILSISTQRPSFGARQLRGYGWEKAFVGTIWPCAWGAWGHLVVSVAGVGDNAAQQMYIFSK
jgi:hypothetical protein